MGRSNLSPAVRRIFCAGKPIPGFGRPCNIRSVYLTGMRGVRMIGRLEKGLDGHGEVSRRGHSSGAERRKLS
jgi:hypothetical protein